MRADLFFLAGTMIPALLVALALRFAWPAPRKAIVREVLLVTLVPLALLSAYLVLEYRTWRWDIFEYGSVIPHLLAAAAFVASFGFVLARKHAPAISKAILAVVTVPSWAALWFTTALFTACAMGDCL
jgi:hypothetical protein